MRVEATDEEYFRHLNCECDADCKICQAEQLEDLKKQKKKKNEGKRPDGER